jgi:hypothetical protein
VAQRTNDLDGEAAWFIEQASGRLPDRRRCSLAQLHW